MRSEPCALPCPGSAVETADRMNLFLFHGIPVPPGEKRLLLLFLDELHRAPCAYRGLFAFAGGERPMMRFFTGERAKAGGAVQLSHEIAACLKKIQPAGSRPLIREIDIALSALLSEGLSGDAALPASRVALWRNLSAAPFAGRERILREGVACLRADRDGKGRWNGWPFYYTLLALTEMPVDIAQGEIAYALPSCRRAIARLRRPGTGRRHALLMRVLAQYSDKDASA